MIQFPWPQKCTETNIATTLYGTGFTLRSEHNAAQKQSMPSGLEFVMFDQPFPVERLNGLNDLYVLLHNTRRNILNVTVEDWKRHFRTLKTVAFIGCNGASKSDGSHNKSLGTRAMRRPSRCVANVRNQAPCLKQRVYKKNVVIADEHEGKSEFRNIQRLAQDATKSL